MVLIMTDSNSGITHDLASKLGVEVIPMPFMIDGEEYFENINLTQEQFYNLIQNDANVCTSQPAIGLIASVWDKALETYDEILYIPMSSGLSMSYMSAHNLSLQDEYNGKVYVVDNKRISVTQYRAVMDAIKLKNEGKNAKEIKEILLDNSMNSSIYIMVDTLKYLRKGGRITPAVAIMGSLLKIKPILQIQGDKLDKFKQTRTIENAKRIMIDKSKEDIIEHLSFDGNDKNIRIDIAYTYSDIEAKKFAEQIKEEFGVVDVLIHPLSLSVACHIGPGSLAIALSKELVY